MGGYLIYGANGYTGRLIAREAAKHGLPPVLAGRNAEAVGELARQLQLEHRVFSLDDPTAVDAGLNDVAAVLNCAGPFSRTARPLADACLRARRPLPGRDRRNIRIRGAGRPRRRGQGRRRDADAGRRLRRGPVRLPGGAPETPAAGGERSSPSAFRRPDGFSRGTATTMVENLPRGRHGPPRRRADARADWHGGPASSTSAAARFAP